MKIKINTESILITLTAVLCVLLLFNLFRKLTLILPCRVNCWFCNQNSWVKIPERNSWTCSHCDQYNGFTKDGDYNKQLIINNGVHHDTKNVLRGSSPKNGLCKMCNINQQLKVIQLANFVPMNERNFDEEVEAYRLQLEKAYKLCTPCKKVLDVKLCKEKETFLGSKLLQARTPDSKHKIDIKHNKKAKTLIWSSTVVITAILIVLISKDCYRHTEICMRINVISQGVELISSFVERILSIVKMKALWTFPELEKYAEVIYKYYNICLNNINKHLNINEFDNEMAQIFLGVLGCLIQIIRHILEVDIKYVLPTDILWLTFMIVTLGQHSMAFGTVVAGFIKLFCTAALFIIYISIKGKSSSAAPSTKSPKRMKNLVNGTNGSISLIDDTSEDETDDDVSLSKYGVHNFSDSSNETVHPLNNTLMNGRSFTPRSSDNLWTKPKNSTYCVTKNHSKPNATNDNVFIKPAFNKYQNLIKDESDSELDESISCLSIGSPKKKTGSSNSIFSLRKFNATPSFVAPTVMPLVQRRPLISPSKLGHGTSWVAGGYWGAEGNRQIFNINGSRSSSQSSGFESQTSSLNQRNVFSQPPSREESVCGEPDAANGLLDRFHTNCSVNAFGGGVCQNPQNFGCPNSPVYPQMRYDCHVHIPQPRFVHAQPNLYGNYPLQPQFAQNGTFKTPGRSLIKLPQMSNSVPR